MQFPTLTPLVLILLLLYFITSKILVEARRRRFQQQNDCLPPRQTPQFDRILGLDLLLKGMKNVKNRRMVEVMYERFLSVGFTYSLRLGGETAITTIEPENVQAMLAHKFGDFDLGWKRRRAFASLIGDGIFAADGAEWHFARTLIRPAFVRSQVADLGLFEDHIANFIHHLPKDGSTVDLKQWFSDMVFEIASEYFLGEPLKLLGVDADPRFREFVTAFEYADECMARRLRMGHFVVFDRDPKFVESSKFTRAFVDRYVQKALALRKSGKKAGEDDRYVFLHGIAQETDDPIILRDQIISIITAGAGTTNTTLANTFWILARRPDIFAKLRKEILALNNEKPTFEALKDMKYLRFVINESLRLYPVVPINGRLANKDTVLPIGGGPDGKSKCFVPKDTTVGYSTYAMHRRKDIYGDDALEFRPERWEDLRPGFAYLPFNGGPRVCLGQQFALTQVSYTIVRLLQAFKGLEPRDDRPFAESCRLVYANFHGCKVALIPA